MRAIVFMAILLLAGATPAMADWSKSPAVTKYRLARHLDDEVSNGGFMQFFFNDNFETAQTTRAAVKELCGAADLALYDKALKAYSAMKPDFAKIRQSKGDLEFRKAYSALAMKKSQDDLDEAWYKGDKQRSAKFAAYINAHKKEFQVTK